MLKAHAEVSALARIGDPWHVTACSDALQAPIVVNAAGAWTDQVGQRLKRNPLGWYPNGAPR
ncbi:hypothetical protein [uncultured Shimia sp.]|uniref:hypothetical protein n=1 Tax=uncultured Shimia sp. TaxID=573152 RepID=UPI0025CF83D4|nr:hypothetical protein [uncultured Shimia sp.]